jgi:DNA-nicking Smr family endonuclease
MKRKDEEEIFEKEMADVARAENDRRAAPAVEVPVASPEEREREARHEFERVASGEAPFDADDVDPAEYIEGRVDGLDPRELARLRRGEYGAQEELDLHRLARDDARESLESFLRDAHGRGLRCVRIVHGWGRGSPGGRPVIKPSLPRWLERGSARAVVLAYATAPRNPGATLLLLRGGAPVPQEPRRRRRGRRR